jgi:hypothetical protein
VDLIRLAYLPWLILQPLVASTMIFYEFPREPLALLSEHFCREKLSLICVKEKFLNDATQIHLTAIAINYHDGNLGYNTLLPRAFSVEIPSWMDFRPQLIVVSGLFGGNPFVDEIFRPQLIVVSGLFGGNPFVDGILGHNLLSSQAFSVGIPSWMGFRLSRSLFFTTCYSFHNGILAIRKPFTRTFFFFSRWILAIGKPFSRTFFFFHDGILAIRKPFSRTFFFFHDIILAIRKPFSRIFFFFS